MSTYRTISLTDIPSLTNNNTINSGNGTTLGSPDLKFTLKGLELDRSVSNRTPKGFDYSFFNHPIDEFLPSDGSVISQEDQEDQKNAILEDVMVYGDDGNEILDFDYNHYELKSKKLHRAFEVPEKEPLTVAEMQKRAPQLFQEQISLDDYFSVETSFALNLAQCYNSICPEDRFSPSVLMKPLTLTQFIRHPVHYTTLQEEIVIKFNELNDACKRLNENINEQYMETKSHLKWEIFSNSTSNKNFENGRAMFEALLKFKSTFQACIHENDMWCDIDECINELTDLICDWNETGDLTTGNNNETASKQDRETYVNMVSKLKIVETSLQPNSEYINKNCSNFIDFIEEVKIGYEEFLHHFKSTSKDGIFSYEICLYDDHVKDTQRRKSRS